MTSRAISADFGVAQTGVGYQLKDAAGANVGSRVTAGIVNIAAGTYRATADDAGAVGVYWDCDTAGITATEIFELVPPTAAAIATEVDTELSSAHGAGDWGGSAAGDVWDVLIGPLTAAELLQVLAAVAAGKTGIVDLGGGNAQVTFRSVDDAQDVVVADMTGSERTAVVLTP